MPGDSPQLLLSIITPTYNRRALVQRSIDSALAWIGDRQDMEIVVVDDGSSDGTLACLRDRYAAEIDAGCLRVLATPRNLGASGAKNWGAENARGRWLLMMDSDDMFVEGSQAAAIAVLEKHADAPLVFFRCKNMLDNALMGDSQDAETAATVREYVRKWKWGESLPVIQAAAFSRFPYESRLRGHEGLSYARIMKHVGPALVNPLVVRAYDASGDDRLSKRGALIRRGHLLAAGHLLMVVEFFRELGPRHAAALSVKSIGYMALAFVSRFRCPSPRRIPAIEQLNKHSERRR